MSSEAATHDIAQRLLSLATEEVLREKPVTEHTLSQFLQVAELGYKISQELDLQDPLEGINRDQILNWVTAQVTITQETATVMTDRSHQAWLYQNRDEIDWAYWTDYRNLLAANASFGPQVIQRLDEVTDEILDLIPYPRKSGAWDSRGLVMGNVQSGKTANYLGLICKAADAGYRVIIILTGMHNDLRSQTQKRVDEGFVGKDTQHGFLDAPEYGVGRIRSRSQMPVTFTSQLQNGDFSRSSAQSVGVPLESDQVKIFVVKKHTTVLKTLADWLKSAAAGSGDDPKIDQVPLLLIDDEADQASVNTARTWDPSDEDHEPSKINSRIRTILDLFNQSAYVGYTATPFANIFIPPGGDDGPHGEDLFPRNFILALEPPSNHIGPEVLFGLAAEEGEPGSDGLPLTRVVADIEHWIKPKHKKDYVPDEQLPGSLVEAIDSFILSCATRLHRMDDRPHHNSMLVHVTRFVDVQERIENYVRNHLTELRRSLETDNSAAPEVIERLRHLWNRDFVPTSSRIVESPTHPDGEVHGFEEIRPYLRRATSRIQVKRISGSSKDSLDYYVSEGTGRSFIAIGGDKLSRGLTLEGLTVSYYARPSRMYDTLMQMGRWFGYRPGYLDLCRLYTTSEIADWYRAIARAVTELTEEFREMAEAGGTPEDFGLRVRHHPDLMITNRTKLRTGVRCQVTFSMGRGEVTTFNPADRHKDFEDAEKLIQELQDTYNNPSRPDPRQKGDYAWRNVSPDPVVGYLRRLGSRKAYSASKSVEPRYLAEYIEKVNRSGGLTDWTVLVKSIQSTDQRRSPAGIDTGLATRTNQTRTPDGDPSGSTYSIKSLIGSSDEAFDLTEEEMAAAQKAAGDKTVTGRRIRRFRPRERGLLIIYFLAGDPPPEEDDTPYTAFCISFPDDGDEAGGQTVYYYVNSTWQDYE